MRFSRSPTFLIGLLLLPLACGGRIAVEEGSSAQEPAPDLARECAASNVTLDGFSAFRAPEGSYTFGKNGDVACDGTPADTLAFVGPAAHQDATLDLAASLDAGPYAGRRVALHVLLDGSDVCDAGVYLRVDDVGSVLGFASTEGDHPIRGDFDWTGYRVEIDVPPGARTINLGVWLRGRGRIAIAGAQLG